MKIRDGLAMSLVVWLVGCGMPNASADVVQSPPKNCPAGQVGITGHGGPKCVDDAPKHCPVGWRGYVGGFCMLEICNSDEDCDKGKHCKAADLCMEESMQGDYDGMLEPAPPSADRFVLAAPRARVPRHLVKEIVDICRNDRGAASDPADAQDRSCPPSSKCIKTNKVCLPDGVTKPGTWRGKRGKAS